MKKRTNLQLIFSAQKLHGTEVAQEYSGGESKSRV